jgi:membrane protein DedA with SNARE-associated domain
MPIAIVFFVHYAYLIIFLWVLVEQIGIPIPSVPVLLTAGTLSATHRVSFIGITLAMLLSCIIADTLWFSLGRRYGNSVLKLLCRLSFEASTCVSKTEGYFTRRGAVTLLFAKFVPGLSTVAAPIAGQTGMSYGRFLAWDLHSRRPLLRRPRQEERSVLRLARPLRNLYLRRDGARLPRPSHLEATQIPSAGPRTAS